MRKIFIIISGLIGILIILAFFYNNQSPPTTKPFIKEDNTTMQNRNLTIVPPPPISTSQTQQNTSTNQSGGVSGGGGSGSPASSGSTETVNPEASPYSIFYICPPDQTPYTQLFETVQKLIIYTWSGNPNCLDQPNPYYVILEKTQDTIRTRLYTGGFDRTYTLNDPTLIFNLYTDVTALDNIDSIQLSGTMQNYFHIDGYNADDLWKTDPSTGSVIFDKKVLTIILSVDNNIPQFSWDKLKIYIVNTDQSYYIGTLWFYSQ